ncbi:Multiple C2 and transmembrane domain-containing protein 1 [Apodemus speciosus]|uniref:Multiple C2 and transmembrane domain-containing protein 1 n=1 Tax=Apodemus speciosus TaxID=105296 RepID=A0ABQ0FGL7_APOSI
MEPRAAATGEPEPAASPSFQARLWRNLQLGVGKGKGGGAGRAGGPERRTAATLTRSPPPPRTTQDALASVGSTGSRWSGFKKRKQVLDRVFSSSQPNLCCSSPEPLEPGGAGRAEQGSTLRRRLCEHLLPVAKGSSTAGGTAGVTPPGGRSPDSAPSSASSSLSSSPQPPPRGDRVRDDGTRRGVPGVHLCHQKSSSLPGTACLEQLLEPAPPPAEPARGLAEPQALQKSKGEERGCSQKISSVGTSNADVPLADPGMYQLDITLRRGQSLAARDRGG